MKYENPTLWDKQSLKDYINRLIDENFTDKSVVAISYDKNRLVIE